MSDVVLQLKRQAGEYAVQFVQSGMIVGLGHGTTAIHAVRRIAELLKSGELKDVRGVPCSGQVEKEAQALGIPLTTLEETQIVDITIDGADEVDPHLDLIKGCGGALLREKIVAQASRREVIVVDESKLSPNLGGVPVPVEVVSFGWRSQATYLESLGAKVSLRANSDGSPFKTDQGNMILDCRFSDGIAESAQLAANIARRAGVVEHGLFLGMVTDIIVATKRGIRHLVRESSDGSSAGELNDQD